MNNKNYFNLEFYFFITLVYFNRMKLKYASIIYLRYNFKNILINEKFIANL